MGYNLYIGNAEIRYSSDSVRVGATGVKLDDAPAFGEPTDHTNTRWPSYTAWAHCVRELGIEVMFHGTPENKWEFEVSPGTYLPTLLPSHPGVAPISQGHLDYLKAKVDTYKLAHPTHYAGFMRLKATGKPAEFDAPDDAFADGPERDGNLVRAEWLLFWMDWALKNCPMPVFVNT